MTQAARAVWTEGEVQVDWSMRYGNPSIPAKLKAMKDAGCERILIAPLYPQYCAATTATVVDKAFETLAAMRWQPALRTLPPYFDDPRYIAALADSVRTRSPPVRRDAYRYTSASERSIRLSCTC